MVHDVGSVDRLQTLQCFEVPQLHRAVVTSADQDAWIALVKQQERHGSLVSVQHIQLLLITFTQPYHEGGCSRIPQTDRLVVRGYASNPPDTSTGPKHVDAGRVRGNAGDSSVMTG